MPDLFDILDFIPDIRNRDELIKLAVLHGVNVQRTLQAAADLNRAVDYEAIAAAFGERPDLCRLAADLRGLGFGEDAIERATGPRSESKIP
jgi:hypothetical protein